MKQNIVNAIQEAMLKLNYNAPIEVISSKDHGDFSTNVAMRTCKDSSISTREIAKNIINNIDIDKYKIKKMEIAGPGFINFTVKLENLAISIKNLINKDNNFGRGTQNKYINIEYVSANPTGYLHIGHARGAALGSTLANILKFAGNKVDTEYYVNDAGAQINVLGEAVFIRYLQSFGIKISMPQDTYKGEDIIFVASKLKEKFSDKYKNNKYKDVQEIFKHESTKIFLEIIKKDLNTFNVNIDKYFSEETLYKNGAIKDVLSNLQHKYTKDGALWLKTTLGGDDKDRVLIKKDGAYTYQVPDIAYHLDKAKKGYDQLINVWGADHSGYIKRMEFALKSLGYENILSVIIIQLVRLIENGHELKMSKRLGTTYTLKKLIDLVGVDATRFFLVDRSNNTKLDFDVQLAKSRTAENPIFYIQYAHARANQILGKSNKTFEAKEYTDAEKDLIIKLDDFPDLINSIAQNHKVHLLTQYLVDLARMFHSYYNNNKIIGHENEVSKLALVKAVKIVIKNSLQLLGINAPERM